MDRAEFRLAPKGPAIGFSPTRPTVALLNANPFAEGIANLGAQVVAKALMDAELNVDFGFADTVVPQRPLLGGFVAPTRCDVVAVSVPFEDTYHHVPRMLRTCGIPTRAAARCDGDPVVVAGGMALINPMPLSPFFDAMVIGEGREVMVEVCREVVAARRGGVPRADLLRRLAAIPHVFVPALYAFEVDEHGAVVSCRRDGAAPAEITPARPLDMTRHPIASLWTTPRACYKYDDYYSVMVAMGCHLKCPFCVVGHVQGAESGLAMNIGLSTVLELAEARRAQWGTGLVKLFFASSFSETSSIDPLDLGNLLEVMYDRRFEVRVGSLNVRQADDRLLGLVKALGQERVTFAPETGASLRPAVGKSYSKDDKLYYIAERAGQHGLGLDLYTMIGVPEERPEHVRELAQLIGAVRRILPRGSSLEVSVNPAFAKAQTPYERYATLRPEEVRRRFALLCSALPDGEDGIGWVSVIDDPMCYYQPILALGGAELADVLEEVGARFRPREDDWRAAMRRLGGDDRYFRSRERDETLPWQHITYNSHERLSLRLQGYRRRANRTAVPAGVTAGAPAASGPGDE
jgi:radical SAM superfamily enzyme YgiQ (UPF0313 family)